MPQPQYKSVIRVVDAGILQGNYRGAMAMWEATGEVNKIFMDLEEGNFTLHFTGEEKEDVRQGNSAYYRYLRQVEEEEEEDSGDEEKEEEDDDEA
jgi:hypothetical protein